MEAINLTRTVPVQLPDAEVVTRVLAGEKGLYEILMRRNNQRLYRVVRSYLADPADVQDAMQDAYVKAYEKLDHFRGAASFSTWLIRIGINEALQRLRRVRIAERHVDPDPRTDALHDLADMGTPNPAEQMTRNEQSVMLERAIDDLPETYRVVYMLREVEDATVADTAAVLGISENNVKVRLHRARALLKEALYELHAEREVFAFGNAHCDRLVAAVMARIGGIPS